MPADNANPEQLRQFTFEIALMKSVGQHKNIVSMVGCCIESDIMLVVEYCALGDLQQFLREVGSGRQAVTMPRATLGATLGATVDVVAF